MPLAPLAADRPPHMREADFQALGRQAIELEGVFLNTLVAEMFSSLDAEGTFGGGYAEETWRGMMAEQYATAFARAGGIGLADTILADLIAAQATALSAPDPQSAAGAYVQ